MDLVFQKPIVIVGHMGSGKTTISQQLALKLGWGVVDSDQEIVSNHGPIKGIFDKHGEAHFRAIERETISTLLGHEDPCIVGVGGGAFIQDETRALIKQKAISVFLKSDIDELLRRIGDDDARPMLKIKESARESLLFLMDERDPKYAEADITVSTKQEPEEETLNRVVNALQQHCRPT